MNTQISRSELIQNGIRIETFTIFWMVIEAAVSIGAGLQAGSALLVAFGLDSIIELVSGAVLLWRLRVEAHDNDLERIERAERQSARVVGISLALLCAYVFITAVYGLLNHLTPESSPVGIAVSVAAIIIMPWFAVTKRRLAERLDSGALRGDAASSLTCAYMAAAVLLGLALNALFKWWWAESIASLLFLFWLVQETREAFEEASGEEKSEVAE